MWKSQFQECEKAVNSSGTPVILRSSGFPCAHLDQHNLEEDLELRALQQKNSIEFFDVQRTQSLFS